MPAEMGLRFTGYVLSEQKARQGVPASVIFGFSLLFVILIRAALYESCHTFRVLLSTPVRYSALECCGCAGQYSRCVSGLHGANRK